MATPGAGTETQRLDKWLWHARVVKTRSIAAALVQAGKVRVNRAKVLKASHMVKLGDVITVAAGGRVRVLRVTGFAERRGPAAKAQELYGDLTPPTARRTTCPRHKTPAATSETTMREEDILALIASDTWMMSVVDAAARLDLPQWMIGSGFVRNKVWDHLHDVTRPGVETADIDLIYFDPADTREETDKAYEARLHAVLDVNWETKNQARMHTVDGRPPYASAEDALSQWVETATCVAVTRFDGALRLIAPHGIGDLVNLIVRPAPAHAHRPEAMLARVGAKQWLAKWPRLRIVMPGSETAASKPAPE